MLCLKNKVIGFGIFLSVLLSVLFVSPCSAINNYNVTINDSNYSSWSFDCGQDCSSYHYLLINNMSSTTFVYQISIFTNNNLARLVATHNAALGSNLNFYLFYFDNADKFAYTGANWSSGSYFDITISENNPFGSSPTGSLSISSNGSYDVSSYAQAIVDVPPVYEEGDYHDDLVNIRNAIILACGIMLVLYFFYCIFRVFIKVIGGL